jgi:hypothetical protein
MGRMCTRNKFVEYMMAVFSKAFQGKGSPVRRKWRKAYKLPSFGDVPVYELVMNFQNTVGFWIT